MSATNNQTDSHCFNTIGIVHSPYKEKFAIPRQPGLATAAQGVIELIGDANHIDIVRGLEQFSHIWVLFVFHGTANQGWKPLVRPPRLGGNEKIGALATRSTFRPNPIGMSVVKLERIEYQSKTVKLYISGLDLLDKTPVLDIKPYVQYSDALPDANCGYANHAPSTQYKVKFTDKVSASLQVLTQQQPNLKTLIEQVLSQDPRPAYKQNQQDNKQYGMQLYHYNVQWQLVDNEYFEVFDISAISTKVDAQSD